MRADVAIHLSEKVAWLILVSLLLAATMVVDVVDPASLGLILVGEARVQSSREEFVALQASFHSVQRFFSLLNARRFRHDLQHTSVSNPMLPTNTSTDKALTFDFTVRNRENTLPEGG